MKKQFRAILRGLVTLGLFAGLAAASSAMSRPDLSGGKHPPLT